MGDPRGKGEKRGVLRRFSEISAAVSLAGFRLILSGALPRLYSPHLSIAIFHPPKSTRIFIFLPDIKQGG